MTKKEEYFLEIVRKTIQEIYLKNITSEKDKYKIKFT